MRWPGSTPRAEAAHWAAGSSTPATTTLARAPQTATDWPTGRAVRRGRLALPFCPFTPVTAHAFNRLWYRTAPRELSGLVPLHRYFHRLDAVSRWNRAMGPRGFLQYQFVVPLEADKIITEVLTTLRRHHAAPFLGTLKRFGPASGNYLSFPGPGWSLAVDFPAGNRDLRVVLDHLDRRVAELGGRIYLAKDARLRPDTFAAMYRPLGQWRAARERLDPRGVFCSDLGRRLDLC